MTNAIFQKNRGGTLQRGFSLIELMIAMTLGLLIMTGLTSIFVKNSLARSEIERSNRQIESGRYAMALLTEDLRMAGFMGTFNPYETIILPNAPPLGADTAPVTAAMSSLPDPCDASVANLRKSFFFHVQGYDDPATMPSCLADARPGSDILVVRRANACVAGPTPEAGCDAVITGAPYFQSSNCYQATELAFHNDLLPAKDYQAYFVLDTDAASLNRHAIDCTTLADYRRLRTHIYFVANNNVGTDGIPTLKRAELGAGGYTIVPLVEGIETLQLEYGVDANDDGVVDDFTANPDLYNGCTGATCLSNWLRTYAVKVNLLARNVEASPGYVDSKTYTLGLKSDGSSNLFPTSGTYGDAYKRHAYNATVRLDNPSGRRQP